MTTFKSAIYKDYQDIKILIIDDEPHCIEVLEMMLHHMEYKFKEIKSSLGSLSGLTTIEDFKPDLIFLDIHMPVMNGFDLLEKIPDKSFGIIFTTAYDEYAIKAFKTSAVDYLLKPIKQKEMEQAIIRYINGYNNINNAHVKFLVDQLNEKKQSAIQRIALPTFDGITFFSINEINYFEAKDPVSFVFLDNGKVAINLRFKELEEKLKLLPFYRTHKSYIINTDKINKILNREGLILELECGSKVPLSRRKKEEFLKLINAK